MFRASDIFGRKPGSTPQKLQAKASQKRPAPPSAQVWDPATGQLVEEELPADVQALIAKKSRSAAGCSGLRPDQDERDEASRAPAPKAAPKQAAPRMPTAQVDTGAPSVEYRGFSKAELNDRYYERPGVLVRDLPTYWTATGQFFLYWQGDVQRWSICDGASFRAVQSGQLPGWAYTAEHRHFCEADGWKEAWNGEWREPGVEAVFTSSSRHAPQWEDPLLQRSISSVEFSGFAIKELNTRYFLRPEDIIQGRPSYWDSSGVYFVYWQRQTRRWAICDLKCMDAVRDGQCPGWAYRSDSAHFANACGWMEMRANQWVGAVVETAVITTCNKGLKVQLSGFSKRELNAQYVQRAEQEIQGRASFWDVSGTFFIYWQSSMKRWAICDKTSLESAQSGLAPGWAYRRDSQHFATASSWMEAWGRDWQPATIRCRILEGVLHDTTDIAEQEAKEEEEIGGKGGTLLSPEQYHALIVRVYEQKNPAKLSDVPFMLERHRGREHELYRQVCERYEVEPSEPIAPQLFSDADDVDEFAHLENEELPELADTEYAVLIQSIYERHNPKKLQDMARLLSKYRGRERQFYHEVCKKYGAHPVKFRARQLKEREAASSRG